MSQILNAVFLMAFITTRERIVEVHNCSKGSN